MSAGVSVGLAIGLSIAGCGGSSEEDPAAAGGAGGKASGGASSGGAPSGGSSSGGASSGGSSSGGSSSGGSAGVAGSGSGGISSGGSGTGGSGGKLTAKECFKDIGGGTSIGPNYDQYNPTIGSHCFGTNHQNIQNVQRLVFIGDSVTAGTPPTPGNQFYRSLVGEAVKKKFGATVEIADCSAWGARTDDFLIGQEQVKQCFPNGGDSKTTLVVFTIGGNDIAAWAKDKMTVQAATAEADKAANLLEDTIKWFKEPTRFPNGIYVAYANPYEYTDATGDLHSCPAAILSGMSGNWFEGAPAVIHFQERFMKIAVDHQVDMIFTLEHFCGHGYRRDDPNGLCYRGPNAELWFDFTCTHPNPTGHGKIAEFFAGTINE